MRFFLLNIIRTNNIPILESSLFLEIIFANTLKLPIFLVCTGLFVSRFINT